MAETGNAGTGGGKDPPAGGTDRPADSGKGTEGAGPPAAGAPPPGGCAPPGYRCVCTCVPPKEAVQPDAGDLPPGDPPPPDTGGGTPTPPGGGAPEPAPAAPGPGITLGPSPGASISSGGFWTWRQPGAALVFGADKQGPGVAYGAGILGALARPPVPRLIPSRKGSPKAEAHPAAVASPAGTQQDDATLGANLEDPAAGEPGPGEEWLVFPRDSTRSARLLRFPERPPVAPPYAGTFDRGGAWGGRDSGPWTAAGPGTEDGSERAGVGRESSLPVLAPPRFEAGEARDLTEDRLALGVEAPPGTATEPSDRVGGDYADLDGDPLEPGWGRAESPGVRSEMRPPGVPHRVPANGAERRGPRWGWDSRGIGASVEADVPAGAWESAGASRIPTVAFSSPPAGVHSSAAGSGGAALLKKAAPSGGLPPSPRPSARPGVFAKPTLGKGGGGSYEATQRGYDDAMEFKSGRNYAIDEQTVGVVETLEKSGASKDLLSVTSEALDAEISRAFEEQFAAESRVRENFSSEEQANARLEEATKRYEKAREGEAKKYAAMPNGAEARRANLAAKVSRYARDHAANAKRTLANRRKLMTAMHLRKVKAAVKAARDAVKAAKKAAREAKYAARNGTEEQAKRAAEKAEKLAAEAVAAAAKAEKEAGKDGKEKDAAGGAGPAGEVPEDKGPMGTPVAHEVTCGTCDPPCDADQTCECRWEREVSTPQSEGEKPEKEGGTKGKGPPQAPKPPVIPEWARTAIGLLASATLAGSQPLAPPDSRESSEEEIGSAGEEANKRKGDEDSDADFAAAAEKTLRELEKLSRKHKERINYLRDVIRELIQRAKRRLDKESGAEKEPHDGASTGLTGSELRTVAKVLTEIAISEEAVAQARSIALAVLNAAAKGRTLSGRSREDEYLYIRRMEWEGPLKINRFASLASAKLNAVFRRPPEEADRILGQFIQSITDEAKERLSQYHATRRHLSQSVILVPFPGPTEADMFNVVLEERTRGGAKSGLEIAFEEVTGAIDTVLGRPVRAAILAARDAVHGSPSTRSAWERAKDFGALTQELVDGLDELESLKGYAKVVGYTAEIFGDIGTVLGAPGAVKSVNALRVAAKTEGSMAALMKTTMFSATVSKEKALLNLDLLTQDGRVVLGDTSGEALVPGLVGMGGRKGEDAAESLLRAIDLDDSIGKAVPVHGHPSSLARLQAWWRLGAENDANWRALSTMDKVYYEIGQKTLPVGEYAKYASLSPVARGRQLVADLGWFKALRPQGGGWTLGTGSTLSTGPTPLVRWAAPRAAAAGATAGGGYLLWRYTKGTAENKTKGHSEKKTE